MAREISRAEAWEKAHEVFSQVNFNAFDFNTIKESLLDYTKLYFPEDFNDYIESSEFIAILELFAYIGELLAYRLDMNAHENFITTAQRKESILRLAKLISYKASRNIAARGFVKMTSIQTTESITDSAGRNLSGRKIFWNDTNNEDWKEQFLLVMNRVLEQDFGSVTPNERVQVDDVLFELYTLNNNPISAANPGVFRYSATADGEAVPMELVPINLTSSGPEERRPENNSKFSVMWASDGLGDSSDTTGFLMYTKQGTLASLTKTFDGITPNQTFDITVDNVNETDIWINNINPNTQEILTDDPYAKVFPHLVSEDLRYGEWVEVDLANAQNIIFNTNKNRHKYEIETLDNDNVRIIFGDGEFSEIPNGSFQIWYRTSANEDLLIEKNSVVDQTATFTYTDVQGTTQTLTFTFSLINSLQNASASEDLEHIRRVAPSIYYTQDRMVNGRDYNIFMLQDPSILRLRALNRTYAGDSKYITWHDAHENYEDVKLFGDDMALYWVDSQTPEDGSLTIVGDPVDAEELIKNYIEPLLSSTDFFSVIGPKLQANGKNPGNIRKTFYGDTVPYSFGNDPATGETNELAALISVLDTAATGSSTIIDLSYSVEYDEWTIGKTDPTELTYGHVCDIPTDPVAQPSCYIAGSPAIYKPSNSIWMLRIEPRFQSGTLSGWNITWRTRRLVAHSEETKFWHTNDTTRVVNFDTLNSVNDEVVILKANHNANETKLLTENKSYSVLGQELVNQNLPQSGLPDEHRLSVLPADINNDGIADNLDQPELLNAEYIGTWPVDKSAPAFGDILTGVEYAGVTPHYYIDLEALGGKKFNHSTEKGLDNDIEIYVNGERKTFANNELTFVPSESNSLIHQRIEFTAQPADGDHIRVVVIDYVYFTREDQDSPWEPQVDSDDIRVLYQTEDANTQQQRYLRYEGRYPLNFAWFHHTPRLHLVDPSATNIIDIYIITVGYYTALTRYLTDKTDVEPTAPTPLELRNSYNHLLDNKMVSDTVILHSGKFKVLFGSRATPQLRCTFKVIRPDTSSLTDNQVKVRIVENIRNFFNIDSWDFGESFYFTELAASIHSELGPEIDSVILVPTYAQNYFGDMFQVNAREDEMFMPDITTSDVEIVQSFTPENIRQLS